LCVASLRVQEQRLTNIVALNRANAASLRVQEQQIEQYCNARVPPLSTTGASGSDVASALDRSCTTLRTASDRAMLGAMTIVRD
jgi:hypothetical protein